MPVGTNLATLDAILKNQYLGPIREQLNNNIRLLKRLDKDRDNVVGKNFTIPLHYGRNEGIGARAEGGILPDAGQQAYKDTIVPMRYVYGRIELTGPSMKASRNNKGAFVRAVESEMKGLTRDIKRDFNRMLFCDGSGTLAKCATTTDSTTVVVDSTARLRVGMRIDILVTDDGTVGTGATDRIITGVLSSTEFTISGNKVTTDDAYTVYRKGSRNLEVMGLSGIVSDKNPTGGALQTLDVEKYPWWKANVLGNNGTNRAISDILLQTAKDTTETNSDGTVSALYTTYGVRRAYSALLKADRVFSNTKTFDGGDKAIEYDGLPLFVDKDCQANTIYLLDEEFLKIYELSDFDWMDEDGAILCRVSGKDAYEAVLYRYCELGCSARNTQTVIKDVEEA